MACKSNLVYEILGMNLIQKFRKLLLWDNGEIHYIGGSEILPAPLGNEEESRIIGMLGSEQDIKVKSTLIEHNLRLVVYIAKKI